MKPLANNTKRFKGPLQGCSNTTVHKWSGCAECRAIWSRNYRSARLKLSVEDASSFDRAMVTPFEAASLLNVCTETIRRMIRAGNLRACRVGGGTHLRIPISEIYRIIKGEGI